MAEAQQRAAHFSRRQQYDGSKKLPLLVIRKSEHTRCFKGKQEGMGNEAVIRRIVRKLDRKFEEKKQKVLLFVEVPVRPLLDYDQRTAVGVLPGGAGSRHPGAGGRALHHCTPHVNPCVPQHSCPGNCLLCVSADLANPHGTPEIRTNNFCTSSGWYLQSLFCYLQVKLCTVFQVRRTPPRHCAPGQAKMTSAIVSRMLAWKYVYLFMHKSACNFELRHCALHSELGIFVACLNCTLYQRLQTNITYRLYLINMYL